MMSPTLPAAVRGGIRFARIVFGSSLVLAAGAGELAAQNRVGTIVGTVKDDLGAPITNVEVSVPRTSRTVRTDTAGKFLLSALTPGATDVSFRRLAFAPVVLSIIVPHDDTTEVDVTLTIVAHELKGVVSQADAPHLRQLDAFESRRRLGIGHFITRGEIERRNPGLLSDMMRMIPGAMILQGPSGRAILRFARTARACPPQFFIDGVQAYGFSVDDMPVSDVEGVEMYAGPSGLPVEYNKVNSTVNCGTIIIWTRIPGT
jgi:Carboxypeptidase regulatory-like domain/TonB-dependent Receptor Plug Domain